MPIYDFDCPKCGIFKEKKPINMDLSKSKCPICESLSKRIWKVPKTMNDFMPDVKGSSKVSKKIMKEAISNGVYSKEPPDGKFWNDVKSGKIVKKGNMYVRKEL